MAKPRKFVHHVSLPSPQPSMTPIVMEFDPNPQAGIQGPP